MTSLPRVAPISPIYDSVYAAPGSKKQRGWRAGYVDFRYGKEEERPVYNPAAHLRPRALPDYLTADRVAIVADLLRRTDLGHVSRWSSEAEVRHGLRRAILDDGVHNWHRADATAAELVRRAFVAMGAGPETRPAFDEGQRYATQDDHTCRWCGEHVETGSFCCAEHARLALRYFDFEIDDKGATPLGRAAYKLIRREQEPERQCAAPGCTNTFRPLSSDSTQAYCSARCVGAALALKEYDCRCLWCDEPFTAHQPNAKFCSPRHRSLFDAARDGRWPAKISPAALDVALGIGRDWPHNPAGRHSGTCEWCARPFENSASPRFCSPVHASYFSQSRRGVWPKKLSPPVFDLAIAA